MRFNEFKLRQWEKENLKEFPKRWRMYDVVIEVRNIQAKDEETAKKQALDLITSPYPANIKIEAFEKRTIDDLVKVYGMTKIAHKIFTEGLFSLAEVKIKGEKERDERD